MVGSKNQHVRKDNGSQTEREEGSHRVGATLTESILIDNAVVSSTELHRDTRNTQSRVDILLSLKGRGFLRPPAGFAGWLRWVPPTDALLQRRTTKRLHFWAARSSVFW